MRVVVTGGRDFVNRAFIYKVLDSYEIDALAHGGAKGADTVAGQWASERSVPCTVFPAKWNELGKLAGFARNAQMLDRFKPDLVIAFPGGTGTTNCCICALARRIPIKRHNP